VDTQIVSEYANASDYIRDLIRHDQRQREALKIVLIEAEQSKSQYQHEKAIYDALNILSQPRQVKKPLCHPALPGNNKQIQCHKERLEHAVYLFFQKCCHQNRKMG